MSRPRSPYVWRNVFYNFIDSLRPKKITGNLMGQDQVGNKYYEIPAEPSLGKRKPSRWFTAPQGEAGFDNERPAEWDAWLRMRRSEPPSEEEIQRNQAIMEMKKKNAAVLDEQARQERIATGRPEPSQDVKGMYSFPLHEKLPKTK